MIYFYFTGARFETAYSRKLQKKAAIKWNDFVCDCKFDYFVVYPDPCTIFSIFCEEIANGNNTLLLSICTHSHIIIITCVLGLLHSFSRKR